MHFRACVVVVAVLGTAWWSVDAACDIKAQRKTIGTNFRTYIYNGDNQTQSVAVLNTVVELYVKKDGLNSWIENYLNEAIMQASEAKRNLYLTQVNAAYKSMGASLFGTAYANLQTTHNKLFQPFYDKAVAAITKYKKSKPAVRNCEVMKAIKPFFTKKMAAQWNANFKASTPKAVYDAYKSYMKGVFPWLKL